MISNQNNVTMSRKYNYDYEVKNSGKCKVLATCSTCMFSVAPRNYGEPGADHYFCTAYHKDEGGN